MPATATAEEAQFYAQLVDSAPRSETVKDVDFRFGEDSDGDPAVWITILTGPDDNSSDEQILELRRAAKSLQDAILKSGFNRWPYVKIVTE